ncbi:MAG: peptidylprolyl isomerase [Deltaproteobacteria bacterium]|nr:peptidylprolyl isomerase [Deltaproteobacteria bacterium]MBW2532943.1 peptidylprolyl isomerase [Deltaproteobacteria bacterium]
MLVASTILFACALVACEPKPEPGGTTTAATAATAEPTATASAEPVGPPLLNPKAVKGEAPAKYKAKFETTKGDFVIEVTRDWAPRGADRFYNLIKIGFYKDMAFHRVVEDFVVQFGINGDPKVSTAWRKAYLMDEMVKESNKEWTVTFAKSGSDTRTTQVFINLKDNSADLDKQGFSPFGKVVEGQDVIKKLYAGYGEKVMARGGNTEAFKLGNPWLKEKWPELDYIKSSSIME